MDLIVEQYPDYHEQILKSALVYQYLHRKYFKLNMPINAIIKLEHSMGLTGPGDGLLAKFLQNTLGWSELIQTHSILHAAFGRFYLRYEKGRGYMYSHKSKFNQHTNASSNSWRQCLIFNHKLINRPPALPQTGNCLFILTMVMSLK